MDDDEKIELSNAELKKLLDRTLIRFENWRVEVERNPNPHAVHQLKNLVSIIDSISSLAGQRMQFSYKQLAMHMAKLVNEVAALNTKITSALLRDDYLDAEEERIVTEGLVSLVQSAIALISMVQESFGDGKKSVRALPAGNELVGPGPARLDSPVTSNASLGGQGRPSAPTDCDDQSIEARPADAEILEAVDLIKEAGKASHSTHRTRSGADSAKRIRS